MARCYIVKFKVKNINKDLSEVKLARLVTKKWDVKFVLGCTKMLRVVTVWIKGSKGSWIVKYFSERTDANVDV